MPLALAIVLAAPAAGAGEAAVEIETVELDYHAPPECPREDAFVSAVSARTGRARIVRRAPEGRRFVVDVHHAGVKYVGRLVVEHAGERSARDVSSARCEDLVEALVFFTAIAIDPAASLGAPTPTPGPAAPVELSPSAPPPPPPGPAPAHREPAHREPARSPPRESPARDKPARPSRTAWHVSIGSGAWIASGIAESTMGAAHPVIDVASSATGLTPSVRVGLAWANSTSQPAPLGRLTLGLRALVVSGCALHLHLGEERGVDVRACAVLEAGLLAIRPFALEHPTSPDRPWLALGPLVRIEAPILPHRLAIGVEGAVAAPLEREHVYPQAGPTVELVRPVGARLGATLVVRLF